jgi:hypothetical protein
MQDHDRDALVNVLVDISYRLGGLSSLVKDDTKAIELMRSLTESANRLLDYLSPSAKAKGPGE